MVWVLTGDHSPYAVLEESQLETWRKMPQIAVGKFHLPAGSIESVSVAASSPLYGGFAVIACGSAWRTTDEELQPERIQTKMLQK